MSTITVHIKSGQNKWDVSIDPNKSILELKQEIAKISDIPSANQRLIYSGRILKNDSTIAEYKIQDGHSIHLVKSMAAKKTESTNSTATTASNTPSVPSNIATGQQSAFNPLADLTGARYAGYGLNLPSASSFGPDGGMVNQDDIMQAMENPMVQSQINEMLSNPQMVDFLIQSNPQFQALGPNAREILTSPFFRNMLTNPQMMRQSMQFARMMGGDNGAAAAGFPAPSTAGATTDATDNTTTTTTGATDAASTTGTGTTNTTANANPFASLFGNGLPPPNPQLLSQLFGSSAANTSQPQDTRPPEERYEQQLRQLNDMGFFDFDRNVAALRRSGGSVQGAIDALLNE
ncbi:related to Ubiquitin domain-containing protein DSK2 [Saccharomycodes ludwigii]|uniref:Related to Ubiquitin domain-containing protein DSK2 n=1 Tax=Saccharomycodes ludwigii TaxID=36035 RepID=A0A376B3G0_9ASCO|nr:related to Ubiquitin domain-containing protein DSK2 [Saccharomycodes ludwigii]